MPRSAGDQNVLQGKALKERARTTLGSDGTTLAWNAVPSSYRIIAKHPDSLKRVFAMMFA